MSFLTLRGLISYQPNFPGLFRRAGDYVGVMRAPVTPVTCDRRGAQPRRLRRSRQLVSTGVLCRKASSSICLTRKSATSAREMNPHVQRRGSTNAR